MDGLITFCGKYLVIVPVLAAAFVALRLGKKRTDYILLIVGAGILSYALAKIGHHVYDDPRPFIANPHIKALYDSSTDNGFPSDHTLLASLLAFATLYYSRAVGVGLLIVAVLVAWGRVAGHVHHLKDVVGSFVITALGTFIVMQLLKIIRKARPEGADSPQSES